MVLLAEKMSLNIHALFHKESLEERHWKQQAGYSGKEGGLQTLDGDFLNDNERR